MISVELCGPHYFDGPGPDAPCCDCGVLRAELRTRPVKARSCPAGYCPAGDCDCPDAGTTGGVAGLVGGDELVTSALQARAAMQAAAAAYVAAVRRVDRSSGSIRRTADLLGLSKSQVARIVIGDQGALQVDWRTPRTGQLAAELPGQLAAGDWA